MKKKLYVLVSILCVFCVFFIHVKADMGPKPAAYLTIGEGIKKSDLVMILGQDGTSYGPNEPLKNRSGAPEISGLTEEQIQMLMDYKDSENYVVFNMISSVGGDNYVSFSYFCPKDIKIGILNTDKNELYVSDRILRQNHEDYYLVEYVNGKVTVTDNFNIWPAILKAGIRMLITIAVELGIALLFGYREKKQIFRILWTNVFTQLLLNAFIVFSNRVSGILTTFIMLWPIELVIFIIEGIIYHIGLGPKKGKNWLYALIANIISAAIGIYSSWI